MLLRGHTGTRTRAEAPASTDSATKVDVDGSIPFYKKAINSIFLKPSRRVVRVLVACGTPGYPR